MYLFQVRCTRSTQFQYQNQRTAVSFVFFTPTYHTILQTSAMRPMCSKFKLLAEELSTDCRKEIDSEE